MENTDYAKKYWEESTADGAQPATAEVPCQNCGRTVVVILPFYGCVFCGDCAMAQSISWQADAPEFKKRA